MEDTKSAANVPSLGSNNIVFMDSRFTNQSIRPVIEFILTKNFLPDSKKPEYLTLVINSPGGECNSAFALIDVMKGSSIPVRTLGLGSIASCGILAFMAGATGHRTLTPNTSILSHQWAWGSVGKSHELFATVREFELTEKRMMNLYKKCTGLSEKKIREVLLPAQDVWLSAEEAVKYGVADSIKTMF